MSLALILARILVDYLWKYSRTIYLKIDIKFWFLRYHSHTIIDNHEVSPQKLLSLSRAIEWYMICGVFLKIFKFRILVVTLWGSISQKKPLWFSVFCFYSVKNIMKIIPWNFYVRPYNKNFQEDRFRAKIRDRYTSIFEISTPSQLSRWLSLKNFYIIKCAITWTTLCFLKFPKIF